MFIIPVTYDAASQFIDVYQSVEKSRVEVGQTIFIPCEVAGHDPIYVMFDPLGNTAIIGDGDHPSFGV
ncbi:hypothetical protein [Castellaniella sp.]|uniref:hypothetical protein n=1 Tax=Castellaniella sp. TaxID=1955812 RepID=UPI002AFEFFAE|nr:hypothetical protein [Castellaniella sp.]